MDSAELETVLLQYLTQTGAVGRLAHALKAEVFAALKGDLPDTPTASQSTAIMNELVREYLENAGYNNTAALFRQEADLTKQAIPRDLIQAHLKIDSATVKPDQSLLLAIVFPGSPSGALVPTAQYF